MQNCGREYIFRPIVGNESPHQDIDDNDVIIVKFDTTKNFLINITMFPQRNFHKYTRTSADSHTHNQINHILIDRRWHSTLLDERSS